MDISLFQSATSTDPQPVNLEWAITSIVAGHEWMEKIKAIRTLSGDAYDKAKRDLPAITWSGEFSTRKASAIINYSHQIILDIDKLTSEQIDNLKSQLWQDEYCRFAFTSPSGKGLKCLFEVNTGPENHLGAFLHLQNYFENKYLVKVDDSGKDICRLCFVSCDLEAVAKAEWKVFQVDIKYGVVNSYTPPSGLANYKPTADLTKIYEVCLGWISNKFTYTKGQRNTYVHALACALNRCGVSAQDTESLLLSNFSDLDTKEIQHVVKSGYFHNSAEHGTVEIKDVAGIKEFKAPPYIANYTDDVVLNDLMRITANLHHYKLPKQDLLDIVSKVAKYYKKEGLIDLDRKGLMDLMNESIKILKAKVIEATDGLTLNYTTAAELGNEIINIDFNEKCIPTSFTDIDAAMRGGLMPGNFYGIIGVGGTFKSIIAEFIAVVAASMDKPVLYLNGEMSTMQFYERLCSLVLHIRLYRLMVDKKISKENIGDIIAELNTILHNNLFFVGGTGFGKDAILATIANIEAKTGKKVGAVIVDGVSQMDNMNMAEAPAAIENTRLCKEIAKNANDGDGTVVIGLMHVSGEQAMAKVRRDNGPFCRGGGKTTANMDGYFSTSLLVDPATNELENDDILFLENKFYLRYVDKRSGAGTVSCIINVDENLKLTVENENPSTYEVKINKKI